MPIHEIAQPKPVTVSSSATVLEAASRMRRYHVGDLVVTEVVGAVEQPIGILTDRDVCVGMGGPASEGLAKLTVREVMKSEGLVTINENVRLEVAVDLMVEHGVRRLPVVNDADTLVGIVTLDDLFEHYARQLHKLSKVVIRQRQREVRELR